MWSHVAVQPSLLPQAPQQLGPWACASHLVGMFVLDTTHPYVRLGGTTAGLYLWLRCLWGKDFLLEALAYSSWILGKDNQGLASLLNLPCPLELCQKPHVCHLARTS